MLTTFHEYGTFHVRNVESIVSHRMGLMGTALSGGSDMGTDAVQARDPPHSRTKRKQLTPSGLSRADEGKEQSLYPESQSVQSTAAFSFSHGHIL